jgi:hypothetical protein
MRSVLLIAFLATACTDHLVYVSRTSGNDTSRSCGTTKADDGCSSVGESCVFGGTSTLGLVCVRVPDQKCAAGSAGARSSEGGCCSEWIACEANLACVPQGNVYPGSQGICVAVP